MTLDELIAELEKLPPDLVVDGFNHAHSYRGYYDQLAFEPACGVTIKSMLDECRYAEGRTFTGYKGGEFLMDGLTDCWLAEWGKLGHPIYPVWLRLIVREAQIKEESSEVERLRARNDRLEAAAKWAAEMNDCVRNVNWMRVKDAGHALSNALSALKEEGK